MLPLFIANWKMNHTAKATAAFCREFFDSFEASEPIDVGIAPPLTSLAALKSAIGSRPGIMLGAQNAHWLSSGAHTGEISTDMLTEQGVQFVIVGHSERRQFYGETDESVSKRARAVIDAEMVAIVCIGESEEQFRAEKTSDVVVSQLRAALSEVTVDDLAKLVIAYEPIWAIGTGLAATPEIAENVHSIIRKELLAHFGDGGMNVSILYGGSTKPENIAELVSRTNVDGALVGGASLKPDSFSALIQAGRAAYS